MTTNLKIRTFEQAGWHISILSALAQYQCAGLEVTVGEVRESVAKSMSLDYLRRVTRRVIDDPACWIIAGHAASQPDNRIVRHRKLWASLGVNVSASPELLQEWPVPAEDGLRFFGAIRSDLIADELLLNLWKNFSTVWLLMARDFDLTAIQHELALGWGDSRIRIPDEILRCASEHDAFLVRDFGPTDNFDQGMIVIARDKLIETLAAHSIDA